MKGPSRTATGYPAPPYHQAAGGQAPSPYSAYSNATPSPYTPQLQFNYNPNKPQRNYSSRSCVRAFFATVTCLVVIFGAIIVIIWLVFRPGLPDFRVDSLSLSNFSTNPQSVSGTWLVGFLVRNGNKKIAVRYNGFRSSVYYDSAYLSEVLLPPLKQGTKSQTTLNATLSAVNAFVERRVVDKVNIERANGSIGFDVQVFASTSFRFGSWSFRTRVLKVLCPKVLVGISSNSSSGKLVGGARECQVWT